MPLLSLLLCTLFVLPSAFSFEEECKNHSIHVHGTGPIALVGLMNLWGEKYAAYRVQFGYDVQVTYNDSASHKAMPRALQPRVWYTTSHLNNRSALNPATLVFPYCVRALVVIFNLADVTTLRLTLQTLADIYSGNITYWDDDRIREHNPNVTLPSRKIHCVARQESGETTTGLFTQFLSDVSSDWSSKYGSYFGPAFSNNTCCNSTAWPPNVIGYFARDVVGVVGLVSSIADTIGYITIPSITEYAKSLTMATLLSNDGLRVIEPSVIAQRQVMRNYVNDTAIDESSTNWIVMSKEHFSRNGAYPMTSITYMTINMSIVDSTADCCASMELMGFIDWILDKNNYGYFSNQSYAPILQGMARDLRKYKLNNVTCNSIAVYDQLIQSRRPPPPPPLPMQNWQIGFLTIGCLFLLITSIYAYLYQQRKKRADVNQWLIPLSRIRLDVSVGQKSKFRSASSLQNVKAAIFRQMTNGVNAQSMDEKYEGEYNDAASINSDPIPHVEVESRRTSLGASTRMSAGELPPGAMIGQLKDLSLTGELDGNLVSVVQLNLGRWTPTNWSSKTKRLMTNLKSWSAHKNLATIMGIVCTTDGGHYVVAEYCSKGTLHYVLSTCRYRLTDTIRRFLCLDVARALAYLHERNLASGRLNSLTCYMDSSWKVRVGEWHQAPLFLEELQAGRPCPLENLLGVSYRQDDLMDEERLIRLLYVDPSLFCNQKSEKQNSPGNPTSRIAVYKKADSYSFGYLLAEIYSGHLPYTVEAEMDDFSYSDYFKEKFLQGLTPRTPALPQQTPLVVLKIIEQCLKNEPNTRPNFMRIYKSLNEMNVENENKKSNTAAASKGIVDVMMETMDSYAQTLEDKVEERTIELKALTRRMRDLLNEVLPPQVAEKLFTGQVVAPEYFECVTIYFSDIVGFTNISAQSTPLQVMGLLNDLWLSFDSVIDKFDVYKVDTIGDAYMVCSGLPNRNGTLHCDNICQLSLALLERCGQFKILHLPAHRLRIRIGVNSGPVTAGVVGSKMPQYCVFGDTVNTAARMESTSVPNKIQISQSTNELLTSYFPRKFLTQYRGEIDVKGKGTMRTYWLLRPQSSETGNGMFSNFCANE